MTQAEKIKSERIRAGYSQETLAEAMQVSRQAVTSWESGQTAPSSANLRRLAQVLDVEISALMADAPKPVRQGKGWMIAGSIVAGIGLMGEFLIWLLSTTYPFYIVTGVKPVYSETSYSRYISFFHLEAVVACLWVLAAVGVALLLFGLHRWRK